MDERNKWIRGEYKQMQRQREIKGKIEVRGTNESVKKRRT